MQQSERMIDVLFHLNFVSADHLPSEWVGQTVSLRWNSHHARKGETQAVPVSEGGFVTWNETFDLYTKIPENKQQLQTKLITVTLRRSDVVDEANVAINLSAYYQHHTNVIQSFKLFDESSPAFITVNISTEWLRMSGKKLVKASSVDNSQLNGSSRILLGTQEYYLVDPNPETDHPVLIDDLAEETQKYDAPLPSGMNQQSKELNQDEAHGANNLQIVSSTQSAPISPRTEKSPRTERSSRRKDSHEKKQKEKKEKKEKKDVVKDKEKADKERKEKSKD
eukprot:TRINITY_DN3075_c0_g1_i1.p1 TRINITY_DN3075_c0_g1~~TRINITY_DN3075_c0_g1_i1.p1  ORF type:complete len:280 (-),score=81.11 TRINITY_DN3075_c0_g1_i1:28-867(-)